MTTKADTAAAQETPTEAGSAATPRLVVWLELPQPDGRTRHDTGLRAPAYDPSAFYEDCERWDGMA